MDRLAPESHQALIVEDDANKRERLTREIAKVYGSENVFEAASYATAVELLTHRRFALVILDMTLPLYDWESIEHGRRVLPFGGEYVLNWLREGERKEPVIVVTQFETFGEGAEQIDVRNLDKRLRSDYPENYCELVRYNATQEQWRRKLGEAVGRNSRAQGRG